MSSTVSCRSAAHSVSVSSRIPAQILATPTGWTMKSSPDWRRWSAWCSQENTNALTTCLRSTGWATSSACSSTIANRSASSSRSAAVSSAGAATAPSRSAAARSTGRWARTATSSPPSGGGPLRSSVICSRWSVIAFSRLQA